ncbi:MAG: DUF308 domain-containing protein [Owenweeksia sp.]|nr:DUF308 domain-containing protein [Owenweeksia sp.]
MKAMYRYWWLLACQGLFLIVAGAIAIFNAQVMIVQLVEYLALNFLGFGVILISAALLLRKRSKSWVIMMVIGLMEAAFGLLIISNPDSSSGIFVKVVGGWALLIGLVQIFSGIGRSGLFITNFGSGLISIVFGGLILWNPFKNEESITYLVAFYSAILGIMVIYYAMALRRWSGHKLKEVREKAELEQSEKEGKQRLQEDEKKVISLLL